jgi:hypothetical protein
MRNHQSLINEVQYIYKKIEADLLNTNTGDITESFGKDDRGLYKC